MGTIYFKLWIPSTTSDQPTDLIELLHLFSGEGTPNNFDGDLDTGPINSDRGNHRIKEHTLWVLCFGSMNSPSQMSA